MDEKTDSVSNWQHQVFLSFLLQAASPISSPPFPADPPGSHGPLAESRVGWGVRVLYRAPRPRRGSSVCRGGSLLQWHMPGRSARLVSTLGSDLPHPSAQEAALLFFPPSNSALPTF